MTKEGKSVTYTRKEVGNFFRKKWNKVILRKELTGIVIGPTSMGVKMNLRSKSNRYDGVLHEIDGSVETVSTRHSINYNRINSYGYQ